MNPLKTEELEGMQDQQALFPMLAPRRIQAPSHVCAKCGTGYAGPECRKPDPVLSTIHEQDASLTKELRESIIFDLLKEVIGENANREGLKETPARVAKAWKHWTSGYSVDIGALIKAFTDGAENCDEMVVRQGIPIYSHCEHHLAPIFGHCTIAYIPQGRVIGLSKLDRVADAFARRLQVQERLTNQIADALVEHLNPKGVGVIIRARHMCVESRGVQNQNSMTMTSALRGVIKTEPSARAEFLALDRS